MKDRCQSQPRQHSQGRDQQRRNHRQMNPRQPPNKKSRSDRMPILTAGMTNVLTRRLCLTDEHINLAQRMLQNQFPHIHGLQDTLLCQNNGLCPQSHESVQIHFVDGNHWVTSNMKLQYTTACTMVAYCTRHSLDSWQVFTDLCYHLQTRQENLIREWWSKWLKCSSSVEEEFADCLLLPSLFIQLQETILTIWSLINLKCVIISSRGVQTISSQKSGVHTKATGGEISQDISALQSML